MYRHNSEELDAIEDESAGWTACASSTSWTQVHNVCYTTIVQDAWRRGQRLTVNGWVYGLKDGLVKDMRVCISRPEEIPKIYRMTNPSA